MNVSGPSTIATPLLNVGRFGGGAVGSFSVDGSAASITASTALNVGVDSGNPTDTTGTLSFTSDAGGVTAILAGDVNLNDGSVIGSSNLLVDMVTTVPPAGDILLIDVGGTLSGEFAGLPQGTLVPDSGGRRISYTFGDGNNIALVPEPATGLLLSVGLGAGFCMRRRRSP
jgi:hypothetical protein